MEQDLNSINTQSWTNIPQPLIQAINYLTKACLTHSEILKTVNKDLWCSEITSEIMSYHKAYSKEYEEQQASDLNSKFSSIKDHLAVEVQVFKKQVRSSFEELSQDIQVSKTQFHNYYKNFKSEVVSLRDIVLSTKESIKTELACKYIKPEQETLRLEFSELNKNILVCEKHIKLLGLQFDRFSSETGSRLDIQREDIRGNSYEIQNIGKKFSGIVESYVEELKNDFAKYQEFIKGAQEGFCVKEKEFWMDFEKKSENLIGVLDSRRMEILQIYGFVKENYEKISKEQIGLKEKCEHLERDLMFQLDSLKIETKSIVFKAYEESKDKLIQSYKEDLKYVKSKLEWLPTTSHQLADLSPLEARIFILESRLRREENNRILQKTEIIKGNTQTEISETRQKTSKTPTSQDETLKVINFPRTRSKPSEMRRFRTPDSLSTKIKYISNI